INPFVNRERIIDALGPFEIARGDALEFIGAISPISAIGAHRTFDPGAAPGPSLALLIAWTNEQDEGVVRTGRKHRYRFRFGKTSQIIEVIILPVDELDIRRSYGNRRTRDDRQRIADRFHKALTPLRKYFCFRIGVHYLRCPALNQHQAFYLTLQIY